LKPPLTGPVFVEEGEEVPLPGVGLMVAMGHVPPERVQPGAEPMVLFLKSVAFGFEIRQARHGVGR
jgi:hypothetical protein